LDQAPLGAASSGFAIGSWIEAIATFERRNQPLGAFSAASIVPAFVIIVSESGGQDAYFNRATGCCTNASSLAKSIA
jgi:hypothetical protein